MHQATNTPGRPIERVIVVVLDGLRADAVPLFQLRQLERLARHGRATFQASTVAPSVTAAAMASLFTGVSPDRHGLRSERFHLPRCRNRIDPLPAQLRRAAIPTFTFMARLPFGYNRLAGRIAEAIGVTRATNAGDDAVGILAAAGRALVHQRRGLFVLHWPDADRAGHADGWTSPAYRRAAHDLDDTLGILDAMTGASRDDQTLLIVVADHGGGGLLPRNHESAHPHDRRIPLIIAGGRVIPGDLEPGCTLLDVPATACWALGVALPPSFEGRPLVDAIHPASPQSEEPVCALTADPYSSEETARCP